LDGRMGGPPYINEHAVAADAGRRKFSSVAPVGGTSLGPALTAVARLSRVAAL
jgi:hypothetical protein